MIKSNYLSKLTFASHSNEAGLEKALSGQRSEIITQLKESGLRGRGGAGFPTAIKWNLAAAAKSIKKYVVCNADEGEPGTFKDRVILARHADLVLEGMAIGARAIGAEDGIIYLRQEYSYLLSHLKEAIKNREEENLLGKNILGQEGFNFNVDIHLGAGAYICGEETALIESLEGFRGEPRNRPPFPVDTGFYRQPTIVNNVETFAWAAMIMAKGGSWFKKYGTENSSGLKLFSISGDCARPGVYELPLGISIADLLKKVAAENTKAVQVGGASGQCLPSSQFSRKISFEDIASGGSIIIFDQTRDLLDIAENFLEFFVDESCGQCTPCREGNAQLLKGIKRLKNKKCSIKYLNELLSLAETMQVASKCGLGQSSPNVFVSIVNNFKQEIIDRNNVD